MELFKAEGDEQLDRPNSQTYMEWCNASAALLQQLIARADTPFISYYLRATWAK